MNKLSLLAVAAIALEGSGELFKGIHIPVKDAPPSQDIQEETIAKAIAKRKRKARLRRAQQQKREYYESNSRAAPQ